RGRNQFRRRGKRVKMGRPKASDARGQGPKARGRLPRAWPLAPLTSLVLLAGCSSDNRLNTNTSDPLLGAPAPKPAGAVLGAPGALPAAPPGRAAAPLPAVTSATSTAALAGGTAPLLPGAQDLRITGPAQTTSSGGWQGHPSPQPATLKQPEPASAPGAALVPPGSLAAAPIGIARITTFEQ